MENNNGNNETNTETNTETKYVFIEKEKNILGLIAIILAILGFLVPFLLGGFVLIFLAIVLGLLGLRNKAKGLAIGGIVLGILALLTSPSFWLLIASNDLNNSSKKPNNKVIEEKAPLSLSNDKKLTSLTNNENTGTTNTSEKKSPKILVKKEDGILKVYTPGVISDTKKEKLAKEFGVNILDVKVYDLDHFETLKGVAIQDSDDKLKTQIEAFFNGLSESDKELNYDSHGKRIYQFKVSLDDLTTYKDVIEKLSEYKGFAIEIKK